MKAAFAGDVGNIEADAWQAPRLAPQSFTTSPAAADDSRYEAPLDLPCRYGEGRRLSLPCVAAILIAHLALLWALVMFDVIEIAAKPREALVIELIPDPIEPPPVAREQPKPQEDPVEPRVVAPKPIVEMPVLAPPPVAVTSTPTPPKPDIVSVAAPEAAGPPVAATMVAPSPLGNKAGNVAPEYPVEARRNRWMGTVRLRVVITTDGRVREISVAQSSGHDILDRAALKAVAKWKFQPGTRNGEPVEGIGYVPIPFRLKG